MMVTVDGVDRDLTHVIDTDATVAIVTRDSDAGLELLRHDCAHVLAEAVQELYPGTQITFGPSIGGWILLRFPSRRIFLDR